MMVMNVTAKDIYRKYGTHRVLREVVISAIQDPEVRFATQLLACQLVRKCRKDECHVGVIHASERCAYGIKMSLALYLQDEFVVGCLKVQEQGKYFHYSWVLLLLAMILWKLPEGKPFETEVTEMFPAPKFHVWQYTKKIFNPIPTMLFSVGTP